MWIIGTVQYNLSAIVESDGLLLELRSGSATEVFKLTDEHDLRYLATCAASAASNVEQTALDRLPIQERYSRIALRLMQDVKNASKENLPSVASAALDRIHNMREELAAVTPKPDAELVQLEEAAMTIIGISAPAFVDQHKRRSTKRGTKRGKNSL